MRATHVILMAALLCAAPVFGALVITVEVDPLVMYQQTTNNPCVIGDPSCKQPTSPVMPYTVYSGTPLKQNDNYDAYSPTYTYAQLVGWLGGQTSFIIGIDVNYAGSTQETLALAGLSVWYCPGGGCTTYAANAFDANLAGGADGTLTAAGYQLLAATDTTYVLDTHNGNGWSDALSSSISIAGLTDAQFVFEGAINNDTDGMEEFFLIPAGAPPTPIPEPAAILGLGTVLFLVGTRLRRKKA